MYLSHACTCNWIKQFTRIVTDTCTHKVNNNYVVVIYVINYIYNYYTFTDIMQSYSNLKFPQESALMPKQGAINRIYGDFDGENEGSFNSYDIVY